MEKETFQKLLFAACLGISAAPFTATAAALCMGIVFSLAIGNPWPAMTSRSSKVLLQLSVVGLGFGLSLGDVIRTAKGSILYTVVGIACTLATGHLLGRLFHTESRTSALISFGTAICGGSA
ncbi:MAG TPA: putative sulfate exporter family transporter, partial [Desulfuromonadaceae bacterium]